MGKSKSKKGGGKGGAAPPAKKCTCEHLYRCDCGNRPERPSKGHRWDPETQQWGGKGHKQKGGSGQSSVVGQQAKITEKGKTQLAQWQKLPSAILREHCQKQKRPPPKFKELLDDRRSKPNKFKCRVIVPDPKTNRDKDLLFVPAKPVPNEEQAKEEAALLALLHLTPKLPHERKLPEPYKTTWLAAIESMKNGAGNISSSSSNNNNSAGSKHSAAASKPKGPNSGSSGKSSGNERTNGGGGRKGGAASNTGLVLGNTFASRSEKSRNADQRRQKRNARIRKHEAVRMANRDHPVFLSAKLRNKIQQILRGDFEGLLGDEKDDDDDLELSVYESDVQAFVEERLYHEGFTKRQARTAFRQQPRGKIARAVVDEDQWDQVYEDCLQWLCVHLDEEQLPEGFDPRGGTLEVDTSTVAAKGDSSEASRVAGRFGISLRDANWLLQQQKDGNESLEVLFWRQICKIANVNNASEEQLGVDEGENKETASEEFEAIQAMFDADCSLSPDTDGKSSTLVVKTPEQLDIHFCYVPGRYPSVLPKHVLFLGKWERPVGVAFHVEIAKFIFDLPLGDPLFFEIYGEEQNALQTLEDLPLLTLSSTSVPKPVGKSSLSSSSPVAVPSKTASTKTPSKKTPPYGISMKRRPKARSVFWSTPPKQTPPATPFCWSKSIERQRKALPAWKARDDFLSKLEESCKSSRVVLVTGDTGCGKTTQIPQFILEENPTTAKIVVAQPRRLAVSSLSLFENALSVFSFGDALTFLSPSRSRRNRPPELLLEWQTNAENCNPALAASATWSVVIRPFRKTRD